MKIISGLDWINHEIHYPKKIIDFCLNNKPVFEGCDIVAYIYILNMCWKAVNYKKGEVVNYSHDKVYNTHKERFDAMNCFTKYKSYTNTNCMPAFCRNMKITK